MNASSQEPLVEADEVDPLVVSILSQLWKAAMTSPGRPWSLARLCKQSEVRMSTLRRYLTALESAEIVSVDIKEDGAGSAFLTEYGNEVCRGLFGSPSN